MPRTPHAPPPSIRVPLCLRLAFRTGATDTVVHCPHCGGLHAVELPDGEDVSEPIACPEYPDDMPLVAVRNRHPESQAAPPAVAKSMPYWDRGSRRLGRLPAPGH